jgi:hypothetical protein
MKNLGNLFVNGGNLLFLDTTHVLVTPGAFRDSTDVNDIILRPTITQANATLTGNPNELVIDANAPNTTISVRNNGVNGLDVGVLAANSYYNVFVIGSSTAGDVGGFEFVPVACLLSLSATNPALPVGYDMFRRVGTIRTDATAAPNTLVLGFTQTGVTQSRTMWYNTAIEVKAVGFAAAFTAQNISAAVPALATDVNFEVRLTPNAAGNFVAIRPTGSASAVGTALMSGSAAGVLKIDDIRCPCNATPSIDWKTDAASNVTLNVISYVDQL